MSAPEAGVRRQLSGWGCTSRSEALVVSPPDVDRLATAIGLARSGGGVIARGAGLSYGDAAQNAGGVVLGLESFTEVEMLDQGRARVGGGTKLGRVLAKLAKAGLTLPVVPGTRQITVGGAIAADVHGKNHYRDGSFGDHVQSIALCTPDGVLREVSREQQPELFFATLGGMGLTGAIIGATLRLAPMHTALHEATLERVPSIEQALTLMATAQRHRHSVAWVDLMGRGAAFGRAVVLRSNQRTSAGHNGAYGHGRPARVTLPGRPRLAVPEGFSWALRPASVRAFNALRWWRAPTHAEGIAIPLGRCLFPLDSLRHWNRLYGRAGLVQYQFVVPEDRAGTLVEIVEGLRQARQPMYLAVIKRLGRPSGGMLSFPIPGWTLAVDLPARSPGLHRALMAADELLLDAGGRVYLAKDARLSPEPLSGMYPALGHFQAVRSRIDPRGVMRSDMARRLGLLQECE